MEDIEVTQTMVASNHVSADDSRKRLPRIVLKNTLGDILDTDTKYQRAIFEAKDRMAQTGPGGMESGDWRLPQAPLPARPDFTRTQPPIATERHLRRFGKSNGKVYASLPHLVEAFEAEHDKEFERLRWSVQQAETLPALTGASLIHQEGDRVITSRTYFPFVTMAPIVNKPVSQTDRREVEYEFPGFCSGCRRGTGLCYGCEKDPHPHLHHDKPYRTGGGFSYYRRDKPFNAFREKNPANWSIPKGEPTTYVYYDGMPFPDLDRYGVTMRINRLPEDLSYLTNHLYSRASGRTAFLPSLREQTSYQPLLNTPYSAPVKAPDESVDVDSGRGQTVTDNQDYQAFDGSDVTGMSTDTGLGTSIFGPEISPGPLPPVEEVDIKSRETTQIESRDSTETSRERLYKAPKAFKIKKEERKSTVASSPFSTNRTYDIPQGDGIHISKSDKPLTEYEAFTRGDDSWQAPSAFELKKRQPESRSSTQVKATTQVSEPKTSPASSDVSKKEVVKAPRRITTRVPSPPPPAASSPSLSVHEESEAEPEKDTESVDTASVHTEHPERQEIISPVSDLSLGCVDSTDNEPSRSPTPPPPKPPTPVAEEPPHVETPPQICEANEPVFQEFQEEVHEASFDFSKYKADMMKEASEKEEPEPKPVKVKAPIQKKEMKKPSKRERVQKTKIAPPPKLPRPPAPPPPPEPEETFEEEEAPVEMDLVYRDHSLPSPPPPRKLEPPPLPRAEPPAPPRLPTFSEPERPKREVSQTLIEAPPPMNEPPKQRRPPPKFRPKRRVRERRGPPLVRPAAPPPVVKAEEEDITDPADYLAKYCIIHPDRLPIYERIFNKVVGEQIYRYMEVPMEDGHFVGLPGNNNDESPQTQIQRLDQADPEKSKTMEQDDGRDKTDDKNKTDDKDKKDDKDQKESNKAETKEVTKTRLSDHERRMITDFTVINKTTAPSYGIAGMNQGDQVVKKINFTLDTLIDKYENLHERLDDLMVNRVQQMAAIVRKTFPEITKPDWTPPKKKKKGKKAKASESEPGTVGGPPQAEEEERIPPHMKRVTDLDVVMRMDGRMNDYVLADKEVAQLTLEIERVQEKLRDVDDRIEDLEDEKKLLQLYSRDLYHDSKTSNAKPADFLRRQSLLYQKMHPHIDVEMNLSELEEALQQINGHLLTEKELQFIYHVLDIPGRRRINLQLFSVVAALSEKVAQVDPFIRKLINKYDFEALNVKIERSKDLFFLLDEQDDEVPDGMIRASTLGVELEAGGLSRAHTAYVVDKFNREKKGMVDFLEYLTYVPLFIEIHSRIVKDPLNPDKVW